MFSKFRKNITYFFLFGSSFLFIQCGPPKPEPYFLGLLALPSGSDSSSTFKVDTTNPAKDETAVPTNVNITITFSKNVDQSSVAGNITLTQPVSNRITSLSASTNNKVVTLRPNTTFDALSTYTFTLKVGIKDTTGSALAEPYTFGFTTQ
ncbi:Ig-like domain-containing protein [Leptospira sp. 'Mane']|uniref:Ig-like domain-containing protein n=1 Tax=Leptospira sp. 'Mane' TaxID=3387407 RepID=UPI00398AAB8B